MLKLTRQLATIIIGLTILACSTYNNRVQPISIPEYQSNKIEINGAYITAKAYLDREEAEKRFGFDIRGAGILPVQVVIQNNGNHTILIDASQTLLIDEKGNGWPLLSFDQVYERIKDKVDIGETAKGTLKPGFLGAAAGAIVGAAIGILTGENVGKSAGKGAAVGAAGGAIIGGAQAYESVEEKVKEDLVNKTLRNRVIAPGELVHGFLFFPGYKNEATTAKVLRLALRFDKSKRLQVIDIPLTLQK